MTSEKVNDLEVVKLSDYLVPSRFRTVFGDSETLIAGISEVQVIFNIHNKFAKRLTFEYSTALKIFGYGQLNDKLREINKNRYTTVFGEGVLKRITLNDCGDRFVLVFELCDAPDLLKAVMAEDVEILLNHCRHPNL